MAPKIQVDYWDYRLAIEKVNQLIAQETDIRNLSGKEIVDLVIDIVMN